jgi:hypothetical protein
MATVPHDGEILTLCDLIRETSYQIHKYFVAGSLRRSMKMPWHIVFVSKA